VFREEIGRSLKREGESPMENKVGGEEKPCQL